jgi:hypothetical protein
MKYVIVRGSRSSGKAETISAVCQTLKPDHIWKVHLSETGYCNIQKIQQDVSEGIYVLTIRKKNVLIVSGAPTEQGKSITSIIESILHLEFAIDFAIVAMGALEKLKGFSTAKELQNYGNCIFELKIWRIPSHHFKLTDEWNKRISYLSAVILNHL